MMTRQNQIDIDKLQPFKVISGGQTGVDQMGLKAAKDAGLLTGGFAPLHFRTENGFSPWLAEAYGLIECNSSDYNYRTEKNIKKSDGTLILCYDVNSPGTRSTIHYCKVNKKPYKIIDLNDPVVDIYEVLDWITIHKINTLNVAGNRASKNPKINTVSYNILYSIFLEIFNNENCNKSA